METYTLEQFINNIESRKNMKRNDKVVIAFDELNKVKKTKNEEMFNYALNNKNYDVCVMNSANNTFIVSVMVNNIEFEIGEVIEKTNTPQKYIINLDCACKFFDKHIEE